jgi:excisionase family DNA binding protein
MANATVAPEFLLLLRWLTMKRLLTLSEAAAILRVSKSKLYQERKAGKLRVLRLGRLVRVDERALRRYLRVMGDTGRKGAEV